MFKSALRTALLSSATRIGLFSVTCSKDHSSDWRGTGLYTIMLHREVGDVTNPTILSPHAPPPCLPVWPCMGSVGPLVLLLLQGAGLRRRHAKASWAYLFRLIKLLSSSSSQRSDPIAADRPTTGHADGGDALAALLT